MMSGIETAISDVMAKRTTIDDQQTARRLEDAYAEVVASRPALTTAHSMWTEARWYVSLELSQKILRRRIR